MKTVTSNSKKYAILILMETRSNPVAICGIYCGACPHHLGHISGAAQSLRNWLDGWNFDDVAFVVLPPGVNYPAFREVLSSLAGLQPCEGCRTHGNPVCPIKACATEQGIETCAQCGKFIGEIDNPCGNEEAGTIYRLISKRYSGWNLANLKRIREIGLESFAAEMNKKVEDGFSTCDVISKSKVFRR